MAGTRGARTPHREALRRAWQAAVQVEHADAEGKTETRDLYVNMATMWALIALAEKAGDLPGLLAQGPMAIRRDV